MHISPRTTQQKVCKQNSILEHFPDSRFISRAHKWGRPENSIEVLKLKLMHMDHSLQKWAGIALLSKTLLPLTKRLKSEPDSHNFVLIIFNIQYKTSHFKYNENLNLNERQSNVTKTEMPHIGELSDKNFKVWQNVPTSNYILS